MSGGHPVATAGAFPKHFSERPQMTPTNVTRLAFAAALPPALMSPSVLGQDDCRLRWDTTVGQPGVSSGTIRAMLPFDDGSGPALFIGGKFDGIGGV